MLTDNQIRALDLSGHLSVTANAGAGKTRVLVERFIDILLTTPTRFSEIVAITFTEKAAAELRKKIASAVNELMRSETDASRKRRLEDVRDNLASSAIGTIHSFCAQLLREYPVEADVDAGFTVLDGLDRQALESEALRATMEEVMSTAYSEEERRPLLAAIRMLGRPNVERYLNAFLSKREAIDRLIAGPLNAGRNDKEILAEWKSKIEADFSARLKNPTWQPALKSILEIATPRSAADIQQLLDVWNDSASIMEKIEWCEKLRDCCFTKKGEFLKKFIKISPIPVSQELNVEIFKSFWVGCQPLLDGLRDPEFTSTNEILLGTTRALLRLFQRYMQNYESRKSDRGQLDFDDLQFKLISLLENSAVRDHIGARYKCIMVDEFQDTSHAQSKILHSLFREFSIGNLFIVGDPKQSIYGFRNADAEIFERTKIQIGSSGRGGARSEVILPESFRLLSHLVVFINRIFSRLMSGERPGNEVEYNELIRGRQNSAPGAIELMIVRMQAPENGDAEHEDEGEGGENGNDEDDNEPDAVSAECDMIARRLLKLREEGHPVYKSEKYGEVAGTFAFSDAAVLLRKRKHLKSLERAFITHSIPYAIAGGIGYYQTQEVFDYYNYLSFLLDPHDDVALAGILRSPLFAISDSELIDVVIPGSRESFWERVRARASAKNAPERILRAVKILNDHLQHANRLPVTMLMQRIIRHTSWGGTMAGLPLGRQYRANVEKLIHAAREFEAQGYVMLYDFVHRLKSLIGEEGREGQAAIESGNDAVNIMTVHAAKGLEFPVVFLPFMHSTFNYDQKLLIDPNEGIGFNVRHPSNPEKMVRPAFADYILRKGRMSTNEEEKRIFYVACTRAKDMLILSGVDQFAPKSPTWMQWVADGLQLTNLSQSRSELQFSEYLRYLEKDRDRFIERTSDILLPVKIIAPEDLEQTKKTFPRDASVPHFPKERFLSIITGRSAGEFYSATHIKTFVECPSKYFLKYVLGIPEHKSRPVFFDEAEDPNDVLRGEIEGTITHAVLQNVTATTADEATLQASTRTVLASLTGELLPESDEIVRRIVSNILSFLTSEFGKNVLNAKEQKTEWTVNMAFGKNFLTGTIDRLWKDPDGQWTILDYKTDRLPYNELQSYAKVYKSQMEVYAYLVSRFFRQDTVRAELVFLRHASSPVQLLFGKKEIDEIEAKIGMVISRITDGIFEREIEQCSRCSYADGNKCLLKRGNPQMVSNSY